MGRQDPYVVVFAGTPGTSKTPIAHYVSCEFGLPILSTDQIRFEVREDLRIDTIHQPGGVKEFERRLAGRFARLLAAKTSFIFDGSVDRTWAERKQRFTSAGYDWFMIDMELTKPFLVQFFNATGRRDWARDQLDHYLAQHDAFMAAFAADVNLHIGDVDFGDRLALSAKGLTHFLASRG